MFSALPARYYLLLHIGHHQPDRRGGTRGLIITAIQKNEWPEAIDSQTIPVSTQLDTGGELVFTDKKSPHYGSHNIKNKWLKFDGKYEHYVKPFKGTRYTIVYYSWV